MAIVIEENKRNINWFALTVLLAILLALAITLYYLFFSSPPLIEKVVPEQVQSIENISSNPFDPDSVINDKTYKILRQYINPVEVSTSTLPVRANPFVK